LQAVDLWGSARQVASNPEAPTDLVLTRPSGITVPVSEVITGKTVVGLLRHLG